MLLRPLAVEDVDAVVALWNESLPLPFHVDRRLFEQNLTVSPHYRAEGTRVAVSDDRIVGFVACRRAQEPMAAQGLITDKGWLSVLFVHPRYRRRGVGQALLDAGLSWLGAVDVLPGGDPDHFFPGVPEGCDAMRRFLEKRGFVFGSKAWDLQQDVSAWQAPAGPDRARIVPCEAGWVPQLYEFFERTFPGRWYYDMRRRLALEANPNDVLVVRDPDGTIQGFSSTFHPGSRRLGPSVYWRQAMGPHYGGLGPIGVSPEVRQKGLGLALVQRSIEYVKAHGCRIMGVDWTVLIDFYRKAGFEPWVGYDLGRLPGQAPPS